MSDYARRDFHGAFQASSIRNCLDYVTCDSYKQNVGSRRISMERFGEGVAMRIAISGKLSLSVCLVVLGCSTAQPSEDYTGAAQPLSTNAADSAAQASPGRPVEKEGPASSPATGRNSTWAANARHKSLEQMVADSALIFVGKATNVDSSIGAARDPRTRVSFEVEEVVMGSAPGKTFDLELPGGTLPNGEFLAIAGAPAFSTGETYLVFLRSGDWSVTPVTHWQHGLYRQVEVGGEQYFVNGSGRGIERVGSEGFVAGPVLTELSDTPLGILQPRGKSATIDSAIISDRAKGCMSRKQVREALRSYMPATATAVSRPLKLQATRSIMSSGQAAPLTGVKPTGATNDVQNTVPTEKP
jgi:hypothetical protein